MDNRTERQKYLRLLAQQYPNVRAASSEIIHLQAILSLPKGAGPAYTSPSPRDS